MMTRLLFNDDEEAAEAADPLVRQLLERSQQRHDAGGPAKRNLCINRQVPCRDTKIYHRANFDHFISTQSLYLMQGSSRCSNSGGRSTCDRQIVIHQAKTPSNP